MGSGITHVIQLIPYGFSKATIIAAAYGSSYFWIGLLLLGRTRFALWLATILPAIGGMWAVRRMQNDGLNFFSTFHIAIDLIVVPSCLYLICKKPEPGPNSER